MSHDLLSYIFKNIATIRILKFEIHSLLSDSCWCNRSARNSTFSNNEIIACMYKKIITRIQRHHYSYIFRCIIHTTFLMDYLGVQKSLLIGSSPTCAKYKKSLIFSIFKKEIMNIISCNGVCVRVSFVKRDLQLLCHVVRPIYWNLIRK